jgi:hypothetical protein
MDDFGEKKPFSIYLGRKCGKAVGRAFPRPFSFFVGENLIDGILFFVIDAKN